MIRDRLDIILVKKGLAKTRSQAVRLIKNGRVKYENNVVYKAGLLVNIDSDIDVKKTKYVSFGGLKLEEAINYFDINVNKKIALDVGASKGGFTQGLLNYGAKKVYALDIGEDIAPEIRNNPKVCYLGKTDIRNVSLEEKVDLVCVDVSFISIKKVLRYVCDAVKTNGELLILIKPQFEVTKEFRNSRGLVKLDKAKEVVEDIINYFKSYGLNIVGSMPTSIKGKAKNLEAFVYAKKQA